MWSSPRIKCVPMSPWCAWIVSAGFALSAATSSGEALDWQYTVGLLPRAKHIVRVINNNCMCLLYQFSVIILVEFMIPLGQAFFHRLENILSEFLGYLVRLFGWYLHLTHGETVPAVVPSVAVLKNVLRHGKSAGHHALGHPVHGLS